MKTRVFEPNKPTLNCEKDNSITSSSLTMEQILIMDFHNGQI